MKSGLNLINLLKTTLVNFSRQFYDVASPGFIGILRMPPGYSGSDCFVFSSSDPVPGKNMVSDLNGTSELLELLFSGTLSNKCTDVNSTFLPSLKSSHGLNWLEDT